MNLQFGGEGAKGQKALQVLRDIVGYPMASPEVAGTLIARKLREFQANQEFLTSLLAAVAFDQGRLLEALAPVIEGERLLCAEVSALVALPCADAKAQEVAITQERNRIVTG